MRRVSAAAQTDIVCAASLRVIPSVNGGALILLPCHMNCAGNCPRRHMLGLVSSLLSSSFVPAENVSCVLYKHGGAKSFAGELSRENAMLRRTLADSIPPPLLAVICTDHRLFPENAKDYSCCVAVRSVRMLKTRFCDAVIGDWQEWDDRQARMSCLI